eukprot:gene7126-9725_t
MEIIIGVKYQLGSRIGGGSFGEIYHAKNTKTGEDVACKVEKKNNNKTIIKSQLLRETKIYHMLDGEVGIPKVRWFGYQNGMAVMVMDLLGKSLEDLFNYCGRAFSMKTVLMIAHNIICRIEVVHAKGLLHRDIKPENFLVGRKQNRHTVYLIDFGLAKYYRNPRTAKHITCHSGHELTGTARYASINAHKGFNQCRKDDLESIGYILIYFLRGSLPWQGLKATSNQDKYKLIEEKKCNTSVAELCEGLPSEFKNYFDHINMLGFEDTPDYIYLKGLFRELFVRSNFTYDRNILYDWEVKSADEISKNG